VAILLWKLSFINPTNQYIGYEVATVYNVKARTEQYIIDLDSDRYHPVTELDNREWYYRLAVF